MDVRRILIPCMVFALCTASLAAAQTVRMFGLEAEAGYLGVGMRDVVGADVTALSLPREAGVLVQRVEPDSPAAKAALQEGDVILEYAGIPVLSATQFRRLVSETPPGRTVDMRIWRGGDAMLVSVEIGKRGEVLPFEVPEGVRPFDRAERRWRWSAPPDTGILLHRGEARLGIEGAALTAQMAEFLGIPGTEGVLVMGVAENSPADEAGLRAGDVITAAEGRPIGSPGQLRLAMAAEKVELDIVRDAVPFTVTVHLRAAPRRDRDAERL